MKQLSTARNSTSSRSAVATALKASIGRPIRPVRNAKPCFSVTHSHPWKQYICGNCTVTAVDFRPQNPVLCSAMLLCDHVLQTSGPTKKPSTCTIHKSVFFQQLRQWRKARKPINRAHPNCKMGVAIATSKELIPNPQHSDIPKFGY